MSKSTKKPGYVKLTVYLTESFHRRLKLFAITRKLLMTEIMREALWDYLEREQSTNEKFGFNKDEEDR